MSRSEDLELQFSPNRWSRRYRAEEIVQKHVEFAIKATNAVKKSIPHQLGVPYGPTPQEKFDIFGTNLPDDSPIFIYVHGGNFKPEIKREISGYVVAPLYKNDFKVVTVGYTLCPEVTLPQIMEQIHRAFLKCVEYARNAGSRALYIGGHSSGAQLVASLFQSSFHALAVEDQSLLKGVFLISGLYDLKPLTRISFNEILKLDLAEAFKLSPLFQKFEASKHISFFVIVGEYDTPAYIEQSASFHRKLKSLDYKAEFIVVNEVDHYDIVENMNEENYEIIKSITNMEITEYY